MFNLVSFVQTAGYLGIAGFIFAESGLFIGFFLPGDSLLFTAGFLASQHYLNVWLLIVLTFLAAVLGDSVGYAFGRRVGPRIFRKESSFWFNPGNLTKANIFFAKYGSKAVILARFTPVARTFIPILAGAGTMRYRDFLFNNVIGAALWAVGIPLAGYYLGSVVPGVDKYILPIIALIIILSLLPAVIHVMRERKAARKEA